MNLYGGQLHPGLASVLETALDAVCVMDSGGTVTGWNERAASLFGWSSEQAIGQRLSQLIIPPDLRDSHERGLTHYLATGEGPVLDRRIEVSALNANGDQFPVELSITASRQFGSLLFIGFVRDISERSALAERQQRRLQESDHRVKNMLTVVTAIARQTARSATDTADFLASFTDRLQSLADVHSLLAGRNSHDVSLAALADQVLRAEMESGRVRYVGPNLLLKPQKVLGLSMILHEFYTNSVKYGALCTNEGNIEVRWSVEDDRAILIWAETGPPCPSSPPSSGFGHRMIEMAVKSDLGGSIERQWTDNGLVATIEFPISD